MTQRERARHGLNAFPVVKLPVNSLNTGLSPRQAGEDPAHIRALAEADAGLPPILVRRRTMQVIDGAHRLQAAKLRGDDVIDAQLVDGDEAESYLLAVRANIAHGLPLSVDDRRSAAKRVLVLYPRWSDRRVAEAVGLAPATVAKLRPRPVAHNEQLDSIGRDGRSRSRPGERARRREAARQLLNAEPSLSLRAVAKRVGVSPETVRKVRSSLRENAKQPSNPSPDHRAHKAVGDSDELGLLLEDPFFQSTDSGRFLLRSLTPYKTVSVDGVAIVRSVPEHCRPLLAVAARMYSQAWGELAECIDLIGAPDHAKRLVTS